MNRATMTTLRKIGNKVILILLSVLIIISIIYSILIQLIFTNLFNPGSIRTSLSEVNFYEISKPTIASIIFNFSGNSETKNVFTNHLSKEAWENVAEIIFPTEWVQDTVDNITNSLWVWLDSPEGTLPRFSVNLSSPLQILRSRQGTLAFLPLLQNLPGCANIDLLNQIYQKGIPDCLPYESNYLDVSQLIALNFSNTIIENINFELLVSQGFITNNIVSVIREIHTIYSVLVDTRNYSLIITITLFFLFCLLTLKQSSIDYRSLMNPIIIAGLFSLILFGVLWGFMNWGWEVFLTTYLNSLDSNSLTLIKNIGLHLSDQIIKSGILLALILIISSVGIWLLIHFMQLKNQKQKINEIHNKAQTRRAIRKQFR